ncbi:MAG: hypothetical protein MZW92_79360 [Comamonadaceae bacterium]|nr:hypothetical protein [Comamonadaceae bacterium]
MMAFMGVRISWLMLAMKALLARLAASARFLGVQQLRFPLFVRADIAMDAHHPAGPAFGVALDDLPAQVQPLPIAASRAQAVVHLDGGSTAREMGIDALLQEHPILRVDQAMPDIDPVLHFLGSETEQGFPGGAQARRSLERIPVEGGIAGDAQCEPEPFGLAA